MLMRTLNFSALLAGLLVALFIFSVSFALGLMGAFDSLGSGQPTLIQRVSGTLAIVVGSLPLLASSRLIYAHFRRRPVGKTSAIFVWCLVLGTGALGAYQIAVDPGDAFWIGLPLLAYAALTAFSLFMADFAAL